MKKYTSIAKLIADYRAFHHLSQIDFAALLDIDVRTVIRWEKNETLIKTEKEKFFTENLGIPHQVMRNLNTDNPIAVYYDIKLRVYSLSGISQKILSDSKLNFEMELNTDRIHLISNHSDIQFVNNIQKMNNNSHPIQPEILKKAAKILPELNLVLHDHSGFYAGHITILPLKYKTYLDIRNHVMREKDIRTVDLTNDLTERPLVFYFYSLYADVADNAYYLLNRMFTHFKKNKYDDYIFAGISGRRKKIELLCEMGLKVVWEKKIEEDSDDIFTFLEGNFDNYLFKI
jgi:transcriptional regulator with XRE-family HTH domain